MFPLAGKNFPTNSQELAESIRDALADVLTLSDSNGSAVKVEGGRYPSVAKLKVNLDGATVSATEPPPKPTPAGKRHPGIAVSQLDLVGRPIKYEKSKLDLTLKARDVRFDFARDKKGHPLLVLTDAADGQVKAQIAKADLQALLLAAARELAAQQHITVQELDLSLAQQGARAVTADVRVKAKKMVMTGVIHFKGKLEVDEELNATVSDLSAAGEGVVGTMVAKLVQPRLKPFEGRQFPLMTFSLGDVSLRDLKIAVKKDVEVTARFGSKA